MESFKEFWKWFAQSWKWIFKISITFWKTLCSWSRSIKHNLESWLKKLPPIVWISAKFPGWQIGVVTAIANAFLALIINSIFLIIVTQRHTWNPNGLGTIFEGDCNKVDTWNKVAHGFINVMSTFLLMQSNYCMQLLTSPTRHDVDVAHKKRKWVEIGTQSFRNVWNRHISPWRCFYWTLLVISSVPLHLLWNSVILFSPIAYQYNQLTVTEGYVRGLPFIDGPYVPLEDSDEDGAHWPDNLHILQDSLDQYEKLDNLACKRAYAQDFMQDRADVIVVTTPLALETNFSKVLGSSAGGLRPWPYKWLCPLEINHNFKCHDQIMQTQENWTFSNWGSPKVQYCLSKRMKQSCKLEYGLWITILTIIANILKLLCFVTTYLVVKQHSKDKLGVNSKNKHGYRILITTGDAIASFLEFPDPETVGMSIVEKVDFQHGIWDLRWVKINPIPWRKRYRCAWFRAIGLHRWLAGTLLLSILVLFPTIFLLAKFRWLKNDIGMNSTTMRQLGLGNPSGLFLIGEWSGVKEQASLNILGNVALANTPQLFVSLAYYIWNNQLTAMVAALDYDMYAAPTKEDGPAKKSSLRVTDPQQGTEQQSTYFLTLPLKYWIPNTILWILLHYLASQAVLFVRLDMLDHWLETAPNSISQVGYSVLGLVCFSICAFMVFMYCMWTSLRRLSNKMPLAATCSGALSAACHPKDLAVKHHTRKVHWGVEVIENEENVNLGDHGKISRCTFTSSNAYYPEADKYYS